MDPPQLQYKHECVPYMLAQDKVAQLSLQVEETQFQQYASKVMDEVRGRGGPLKPLIAAAKEGAGIISSSSGEFPN